MNLSESVALVTGASRGLGLEIARLYAARGARLVLAAREGEPLARAAASLPTEVLALPLDVSQSAEELVSAALDRFGRVDVLVNNASTIGSSPMPRLDELAWTELEQVLRINLLAPFHLTQLVLPGMRSRGRGVIINVSSDAAVSAYPGWGAYGTSKAALEHLSSIWAQELEGTGVRVYAVDPGDMNTLMHRQAEPGVDLSHLPGPELPAPFFVHLVESETVPFGRFAAQALVVR